MTTVDLIRQFSQTDPKDQGAFTRRGKGVHSFFSWLCRRRERPSGLVKERKREGGRGSEEAAILVLKLQS